MLYTVHIRLAIALDMALDRHVFDSRSLDDFPRSAGLTSPHLRRCPWQRQSWTWLGSQFHKGNDPGSDKDWRYQYLPLK